MRLPRSLLLWGTITATLTAGQGPPAPPKPPAPGELAPLPPLPPGGVAAVQRRLSRIHGIDDMTEKIVAMARLYLRRGEQVASSRDFSQSRDVAAADALLRAAEHQQHIGSKPRSEKTGADKPGPPRPPTPRAGSKDEITRHLDHVYFRLQQADFFAAKSADPNAPVIAGFARQYYAKARTANDQVNLRTADECAKSADDLMGALENLAQAAAAPLPDRPR